MTDAEARRLREEYLASLDVAMTDLPYRVATDIREGIDEELSGLDTAQTVARIARMGSPLSIAREAMAAGELASAASAPIVPSPRTSISDSRGFAITAAIVFGFGGFVFPILGNVVGAVLVVMSRMWLRWEKLAAILAPCAVAMLIALIGWSSALGRGTEDSVNPLIPAAYDLVLSGVVLGLLTAAIAGLWLLWRLRALNRE